MLRHVLAVAEIQSVIARAVDGLFIHDPAKNWHACGGKSCRKGTGCYDELIATGISSDACCDAWVYIHGLVSCRPSSWTYSISTTEFFVAAH